MENLHWIDAETQALLDGLIESLPTARLLLLVNYRPEYQHSWGSRTYYSQLRLDALPPEGASELLGALLGTDPSLQPLNQLLIAQTEGNPFFLEESVHTLVETHVLTGARGAYRLAKPIETIQVPPTVQAILAARIDRLPPEEKRLLQAAAVVGKDVPFPLLQAIAELPGGDLRQGLTHLQAAEFLYELSLFPDPEYTFKHALTHEVASGSLLHERRRALHAKIVDTIEALYPDRLVEHMERLAHHAFRGEVWEKARTYLRRAGFKAAGRSAYREAGDCFERALEASRYLPQDRATVEEAIELRFALRNALWPLGEFARILPHLHDAQEAACTLGDQPRLGRAFSYLTQYFWMVGEHIQAIEAGQRALAIAGALGDIEVQVPTNLHVGLAYHASGDYRQAVEVLRRNVNILEGTLAHEHFGLAALPAVYSRTWLAWSLAELGQFAEALARGQEAVTIADAVDQPLSRVNACFASGYVYLQKGELPPAINVLERGYRLCQTLALPFWQPVAASLLGVAYARCGRLAEAVPILEQAVDQAVSMRRNVDQALWHAHLSEAYLLAGRTEDARRAAAEAIALANESAERGNEARILRLLGEIESQPNKPANEIAATCYHQALALADELGMRPLLARCHLDLGRLACRTDQRERAQEHLATATTLLREMGMRFWLEQAEAELRQHAGQG